MEEKKYGIYNTFDDVYMIDTSGRIWLFEDKKICLAYVRNWNKSEGYTSKYSACEIDEDGNPVLTPITDKAESE